MPKTKRSRTDAVSSRLVTYIRFASVVLISALTQIGCSAVSNPSTRNVAEKIDETIGCEDFEAAFWKSMYQAAEETGRPPTEYELIEALRIRFRENGRLEKASTQAKTAIVELASGIAKTVSLRNEMSLPDGMSDETLSEDTRRGLWLQRIAQLQIGDRTTEDKSQDVDDVRQKMASLKEWAKNEGFNETNCLTPPPSPPSNTSDSTSGAMARNNLFDHWKATTVPPVYGALKTFATLYQSCDAAVRDPLGDETRNIEGIATTGRHKSGTGFVRVVSDSKRFLASHPYLGNVAYQRPLPSCHDVQSAPSIYDYGGKPFTSTSQPKVLDLFKNGGTGSRELGIDCSALVYSAYTAAGLKLIKNSPIQTTQVNGISSTMMSQPQKNGLTCLDHASFSAKQSLIAGDIIAIAGHVVMVATIGQDPLGIAAFTKVSQCTAANMNVAQFDFTIFQSSPSKNGIGVNRMRAKDYLSDTSTMGRGMIDHAVQACKAKFRTTQITSTSKLASIVRHLGTKDCIDSSPALLTKEQCLSSCAQASLD